MMREESIECSDFEEGNCPLGQNPNNIIQAIYPILLDMYKECCKKSKGNMDSHSAEDDRDLVFRVGMRLYTLKISMKKEHHDVWLAATIEAAGKCKNI